MNSAGHPRGGVYRGLQNHWARPRWLARGLSVFEPGGRILIHEAWQFTGKKRRQESLKWLCELTVSCETLTKTLPSCSGDLQNSRLPTPRLIRAEQIGNGLEVGCGGNDRADIQVAVGPAVQPVTDSRGERVIDCGMTQGTLNSD